MNRIYIILDTWIEYLQLFSTIMLMLSLLALLTGCGDSSSSGSSSSSDYGCSGTVLNSYYSAHFGLTLDLSDGSISDPMNLVIQGDNGGSCSLDAKIIGNACGGALLVTSSVYNLDGSGDPGCNTFSGTMPFVMQSNNDLTICQEDGTGCFNWLN